MDADNAWVNREDDDGTDRVYYVCVECPRKEKCSLQSFKRAACWSYHDEDACRQKVANHLMTSSLHYLSKEDAEDVSKEAEYDVQQESYDDREQYRKGIEEQHRLAEERGANEPKGKGKNKNKRRSNDDDMREEIKRLKRDVDSVKHERHGYPSASSAHEPTLPQRGCVAGPIPDPRTDTLCVVPTARVTDGLTTQKVMMVIDSIERAKVAAQSLQKMAHSSARHFQERATAAMETSTQMADEVQVLAAGKLLMTEFMVKFQAASGM